MDCLGLFHDPTQNVHSLAIVTEEFTSKMLSTCFQKPMTIHPYVMGFPLPFLSNVFTVQKNGGKREMNRTSFILFHPSISSTFLTPIPNTILSLVQSFILNGHQSIHHSSDIHLCGKKTLKCLNGSLDFDFCSLELCCPLLYFQEIYSVETPQMDIHSNARFYIIRSRQATRQGSQS